MFLHAFREFCERLPAYTVTLWDDVWQCKATDPPMIQMVRLLDVLPATHHERVVERMDPGPGSRRPGPATRTC